MSHVTLVFYLWSESSHKTEPLRSKGVKEGPLQDSGGTEEGGHPLAVCLSGARPSPAPATSCGPHAPATSPTLRKTIRDDGQGRGPISRQRRPNRGRKSPGRRGNQESREGPSPPGPGPAPPLPHQVRTGGPASQAQTHPERWDGVPSKYS